MTASSPPIDTEAAPVTPRHLTTIQLFVLRYAAGIIVNALAGVEDATPPEIALRKDCERIQERIIAL
jgi:hypothetical protein